MKHAVRNRLTKLERARRLHRLADPLAEGIRAVRTCATYCLDDDSRAVFLAIAEDRDYLGWGGSPVVLARLDELVAAELAKHFSDTTPPGDPAEHPLWAHRWLKRVAAWPGPPVRHRVSRSAEWWRTASSSLDSQDSR